VFEHWSGETLSHHVPSLRFAPILPVVGTVWLGALALVML
jgi:hypothetical protein